MLLTEVQNKTTIKRNVQISLIAITIAATFFMSSAQAQDGQRRRGGGDYSQHQNRDHSRQNSNPNTAPNTAPRGWQNNGAHGEYDGRRNHQPAPQSAPAPQAEQRSQHYWPHQTPRLPENGDNDVRSQPQHQSVPNAGQPRYGDGSRGQNRQYGDGHRQQQPTHQGNYGNQQQNPARHGNYGNNGNYGNHNYQQPRQQQYGDNTQYGSRHNSYSSNRTPNYRHYEFQNRNHANNRMGPHGNWQQWDNRWGNANDYARRWGFDSYDQRYGWRRDNLWYSHPSQWSDWGGWYSFFFGSSGNWGYSYNSGYDPYLNSYGNSCQRIETIDWIRSNRAVVSFVACRNRYGNWEEIRGTREFEYWLN